MSAEIRALMGRHAVNQTKLAQALGISQPSLSDRLRGIVPWDVDDLYAVAEHFSVDVRNLFPLWGSRGIALTLVDGGLERHTTEQPALPFLVGV